MKDTRPVHLDLLTMKFPPSAIASICHRISGVILLIFLPFALWLLQTSLHSAEGFIRVHQLLSLNSFKFGILVWLAAISYHLCSGIRHLLMDAGYCESLVGGRNSAYVVMAVTLILIISAGIWLW
ncbi:MAG: succinate dehydrogenase cytochrome b556 subunit [Gammaproteobacteria bacterium]